MRHATDHLNPAAAAALTQTRHWTCIAPCSFTVEGESAFVGSAQVITACAFHRRDAIRTIAAASLQPVVAPIARGAGRCGAGVAY
jgi:hypothetical protein